MVIIAGGTGFALKTTMTRQPPSANSAIHQHSASHSIIGQQRPEFAIRDLDGKMRNIKEWNNKIILLNFWATWCPPCKEEIPGFIQLQKTYGKQHFQIIGIAVDEENAVRRFVKKTGMNYPVMAAEEEAAELSRRYGNSVGGLPYSVFINKKHKIVATITGELSKNRAITIMNKLGITTR